MLDAIEKLAWAQFGAAFLELPPERRLEVVRASTMTRSARQDPAYGKFKYLVLVGYYQSEIGATAGAALRARARAPGARCLPLTEVGRASAV